MKHTYLEATYRKGRPLAAYYCLPRRDADRSIRTERRESGLLIDFAEDGRAIGIEITSLSKVDLAALNRILERLGHPPVAKEDLAPLVAA